jgi:hypothetical protein
LNTEKSNPGSESALGSLAQSATLASLELIIEAGLPHHEEVALAMLEIHDRKLFKPASFKNYLKNRWNLSRSRAYQLIHLGRLLRMSTMVDTAGPKNERQARQISARGQVAEEPKPDEYAIKMRRVANYLAGHFKKTPPAEQRRFLADLRAVLQTLEGSLQTRPSSEGDQKCDLQNEPKKNETPSTALAGEPPGPNPDPGQGSVELAAGGKGGSRLNPVGNLDAGGQSTSPVPGLDPPASVDQFSDPAGHSPIPFRGYTMQEARRLGLAP